MAGQERPTPSPLSYAAPEPPRRVSWLDLAGHAMFGLGLGLILVGFVGREYMGSGAFGELLRDFYPHILLVGGFMCGLLVSVRLGPFER
jgi:hypothetical protein